MPRKYQDVEDFTRELNALCRKHRLYLTNDQEPLTVRCMDSLDEKGRVTEIEETSEDVYKVDK
jgi:hypothetical protein